MLVLLASCFCCNSFPIVLICLIAARCYFRKKITTKKKKRKKGRNFIPTWERTSFAYRKENWKRQKKQQTLGICSSQQGNSSKWCMILEMKINFFFSPPRQCFALLIHLFLCTPKLCLFTPGAIII